MNNQESQQPQPTLDNKIIIEDIRKDRMAWRLTELPQIIIMFVLLIGLLVVVGYGLFTAITLMQQKSISGDVEKIIQIFITGSSSVLGFIVFKLMTKLGEKTKIYLKEEKRFTSDTNRIRLSSDPNIINEILKEYYKII